MQVLLILQHAAVHAIKRCIALRAAPALVSLPLTKPLRITQPNPTQPAPKNMPVTTSFDSRQVIELHPTLPKNKLAKTPALGRWSVDEVQALFHLPFPELMHRAQTVHRENFDTTRIEFATLLSVKTGGCEEDCSYCPQAARYDTGVKASKLMNPADVLAAAKAAQAAGATRFCMGAAWRSPKDRDIEKVAELVRTVKALGMETCATLGMLEDGHAQTLQSAGLDYYNHNLDSAPDFYGNVITTRDYQDRLNTLARVRSAGVKVCCGGIVGMGETRRQRAGLVAELANLTPYPESVPINNLVKVEGTPLANEADLDPFEFVRTIAVARITMPTARVRLSAGRQQMGDAVQALCFLAGANSIFYGDKLLTTGNPDTEADVKLLERLGMQRSAPVATDLT